jgi:hypothetical protein
MPNTDDRLAECYQAIKAAMPTKGSDADNAITLLERHVAAWPQRAKLAKYLHLGSRNDQSQAETMRRQAARCCVLLDLVVGGQPPELAPNLIARYSPEPIKLLNQRIESKLPLFNTSNSRAQWHWSNFTAVASRAGDYDSAWPGKNVGNFRYIVFGLPNAKLNAGTSSDDIIAKPDTVRRFFLSTSVITNGKVATYYPYGLILSVPEENIVSTHSKDQATRNYNKNLANPDGSPVFTDLQINDLRANIRGVAAPYDLLPPSAIIQGTTGSEGNTGYNEVTVLGSFGGKEITPLGFFKKVNAAGRNFIRKDSGATYVTPTIDKSIAATGLPVIRLLDNSGLDAPKPGKS